MSYTVLCALLCIVKGSDKFTQVFVKQTAHSGDLILGTFHPKWRVVPTDPRAAAADPAHSKSDAASLPSVASVLHLPCCQ